VLISDVTQVGALTGVNPELSVVSDEDENVFLASVPVDALEPVPPMGTWLEADTLYADGDRALLVRQSHARTEHAIDDLVPTLFLVYREGASDVLAWVAGESVVVGTLRTYEGETYRCIQGHVTQSDWTPTATLDNLWEVYEEPQPGEDWVDSGETVTSLIGAGVIGVTDTAPFAPGQQIRIDGQHEAEVTRIHQAGSPGILVINPHVAVSGGEMIEIWQ
jgi:hypothetical protein